MENNALLRFCNYFRQAKCQYCFVHFSFFIYWKLIFPVFFGVTVFEEIPIKSSFLCLRFPQLSNPLCTEKTTQLPFLPSSFLPMDFTSAFLEII